MNLRSVFLILGKIVFLVGLVMLIPVAIALIYGEGIWSTYLAVALFTAAIGSLSFVAKKKKLTVRAREGLAIAGLVWIIVSFIGALPFWISGEIPSLIDAVFETVSGFTTTGSTILLDIEALSHASLFWRSFTHWIGGMGVLVLALALLPGNDTQSMHIMRAEVPGPTVGKLVSRIRVTARILYIIYIALTVLEIGFLLIGGMPLFDSIVTSFATAGTGGFAIKNASIAAYNSAYIDIVITLFMLLFSVNFTLYYMILLGQFKTAVKSEELRWFGGIVFVAIALITIDILPLYDGFFEALRYSSFQVASIVSTTGFITANYDLWPTFSQTVLVGLMFIGACAGSTGGGVKVYRVVVICKTAFANVRRQLFPRTVAPLKHEGKLLDNEVKSGITGYMFAYIIIGTVSTLLIALDNLNFSEAFTAMAACLNNIGPGLGSIGAVGNFSHLSNLSKIVLIFDMLAGRLELFPILAIFYPTAWKKG
ncbi:MAG: TrkH family potassium uptake protein [Ruminococcaceae bacterium]|nr:TrkH family potassium uptake protein [Oscillospiraceae bacterium]